MKAVTATVVTAIQGGAKTEETRVDATAVQTQDLDPTSPVDNFGEPYLSVEAASESLCSDEEPSSQTLPRRQTVAKPKKRTTEDALILNQEDDPEAK